MLSYTIEALVTGEQEILDSYQNAVRLWREILRSPESATVEGLAGMLWSWQGRFERECGGRYVGQEVMVAVGFYQYYTTAAGFGENLLAARRVADAFEASMCSLEVKFYASRLAQALDVNE